VRWEMSCTGPRKCADPKCPDHSEPWLFCTELVKAIPNGPLSWP
jgi:hypothetical protein